jgi:hypothetical protein
MLRQANAALANVKGCLKEAGVTDLKCLVKVTVYITDLSKMAEVTPAALSRACTVCGSLVNSASSLVTLPDCYNLCVFVAAASSTKRSKLGREMRMRWYQRGRS